MSDRELEEANARELTRLTRELAELTDAATRPLGPPDFMQRYLSDLKRRITLLEKELSNSV